MAVGPASSRTVTAVLGPTNTGKTHLAVERMLAQASGMIGLPLRLLAREVFDRVRARAGDAAVALVTGEEKIIPARPRYWICTVEAMPSEMDVNFLAIDEIQLAADRERGHVFTDRLLHRRGRDETLLLGADTMRSMVTQLLPGTRIVSRPRFSRLSYAGQKKLSRLPRRTAIVAFSAEMVYATAELIRRQRGGAAVVMGSLSPRTRNAQVELFQSGDVDYLVATDAIGMGLNMDVDMVAFAATRKFDGVGFRPLSAAELGQIAGRAGRYQRDGEFALTGTADVLDDDIVAHIENHDFDRVRMIQWRNRGLDFSSLDSLRHTLALLPATEGLMRAQAGADVLALDMLSQDETIVRLCQAREAVQRLWAVCQIPDYRNVSPAEHAGIVGRIFQDLSTGRRRISEDWFARQLGYCDRTDGDLDTLSNRIAHVRTWTFVANRTDWLESQVFWQQRTKEIEDRLSDALHERLTQRFIDRKTSVLMRRLAQKEDLMSTVTEDGTIEIEGQIAGRVEGLTFTPSLVGEGPDARALVNASLKAVAAEISARAHSLASSTDLALSLTRDGRIMWQKAPVARIVAGASLLKPRAVILAGEQLTGPDRDEVQARLDIWLQRHIASVLEPLVKLEEAEGLEGIVRGVAFRLVEDLGVLSRDTATADIKALAQEDRARLRALSVRFGAFSLFVPGLLKPAPSELRLLLWWLQREKTAGAERSALPALPGQGLTSAVFDPSAPEGFYAVCGYRICDGRVVRVDMLERLADLIRDRVFWKPRFEGEARPAGSMEGGGFTIVPDMMSLVGCSGEQFHAILQNLGFRMESRDVPKSVSAVKTIPVEASGADASDARVEKGERSNPDSAPQSEPVSLVEPHTGSLAGADISTPAEPAAPQRGDEALAMPDQPEAPIEAGSPEPGSSEPGSSDSSPEAPPAVEAERMILQVWWPRDTGPFRPRQGRNDAQGARHGARGGPRTSTADEAGQPRRNSRSQRMGKSGESRPEGERGPRGPLQHRKQRREEGVDAAGRARFESKPRPEKAVDPSSPFAVLSALRAKMGQP